MAAVKDTALANGSRSVTSTAAISIVVGIALGVGDLIAQRQLSYPWANLANSPAIWGIAAFALGAGLRSIRRSAPAGASMLIIAVLSYYISDALVLGDAVSNAASGAALFWYIGAVAVGSVGSIAGSLCYHHDGRIAAGGAAFASALLIAEASIGFGIMIPVATAWTLISLGLLFRTRDLRVAITFLVISALLAVIGHCAYLAVGLHGFGG